MSRSRVINLANFQQFQAINVLSDPGHVGGPVVIPQCAQIRINWTYGDNKAGHNILYGRYSGAFAGTVAQAQAIFTALSSGSAWTGLAAVLSVGTNITGVDIRDVNTANNALISSTGAQVQGTDATGSLPTEVAICCTLRTAKAGPQNRGRLYLSGIGKAQTTAGDLIIGTALTSVNAWLSTIFTAFTAQGYTWSIGQPARQAYTGSTGTQHPARTATSVGVTTATVRDNHWDTQRRRGLK